MKPRPDEVNRIEAGRLSASRCGIRRRVRMMGAVRFVVISAAMESELEVEGSANDGDCMMPALRKTVSMAGKDFVISSTLDGRVWKSVMSSWWES